jgi:hypothetical protein
MSLQPQKQCRHWTPQTPSGARCEGCRADYAVIERKKQEILENRPLREKLSELFPSAKKNQEAQNIIEELDSLNYPGTFKHFCEAYSNHDGNTGLQSNHYSWGVWFLQDLSQTLRWVKEEADRLSKERLEKEFGLRTKMDDEINPKDKVYFRLIHASQPIITPIIYSDTFNQFLHSCYKTMKLKLEEKDEVASVNRELVEMEATKRLVCHASKLYSNTIDIHNLNSVRSKILFTELFPKYSEIKVVPRAGNTSELYTTGPLFEDSVNSIVKPEIAEWKRAIQKKLEEHDMRQYTARIEQEAIRRLKQEEDEIAIRAKMEELRNS